ncbi:hypothetical protein BUALT_Bualt16G0065100 [Buddleja alternifolia]|uniref:Reverse transcriptase n=1 Tax=Buddleja alternifolia TaxID=168488 RepID=A0AAV6WA86_9LAMI|nr:hypothetical protein BUALT_Bualt16G0065100 [Buddleja alternifolia]
MKQNIEKANDKAKDVEMNGDSYPKCRLNDSQSAHMIWSVLASEIKDVLFAFLDDKEPGPNGYTAAFLKKAWRITGENITAGISNFFISGKLLKELSSTLITLILKVEVPKKASNFSPIA